MVLQKKGSVLCVRTLAKIEDQQNEGQMEQLQQNDDRVVIRNTFGDRIDEWEQHALCTGPRFHCQFELQTLSNSLIYQRATPILLVKHFVFDSIKKG